MKGVSSKDDKAKPQNGIAETGSKNDIGAGTAQKMTYISFLMVMKGLAPENLTCDIVCSIIFLKQ